MRRLPLLAAAAACATAAACTTAPPPVKPEPTRPPPLTLDAPPACEASTTAEGEVTLGGAPTGFKVAEEEVNVATWPYRADAVLVAVVHDWAGFGQGRPDGRLFVGTCGEAPTLKELVRREDADFGHAALDTAVGHLFFTDAKGASALNLNTAQVLPMTLAPDLPSDCWRFDAANPTPMRDVVQSVVDSSELVVHRGGPCGYEGDWVAQELRFTLLGLTLDPTPIAPRPVSTVAAGHGGRLWLGDAGRCDTPGVRDPQTEGSVYTSDDGGDTWSRMPVQLDEGRMQTAAAQLLVVPDEAGDHVLVRSAICRSAAVQRGGTLFRSDDGGQSWAPVPLSEAVVAEGGAGGGVTRVHAGRTLDTLTVWTSAGEAFRTADGGASWDEADPDAAPPSTTDTVTVGDTRYQANQDGLFKYVGEEPRPIRVFPIDEETGPDGAPPGGAP